MAEEAEHVDMSCVLFRAEELLALVFSYPSGDFPRRQGCECSKACHDIRQSGKRIGFIRGIAARHIYDTEISESIQVEVGGSTEVVVTSVPASGMTGADPSTFPYQVQKNVGPGGTRLKFNLDTRQPIRIRIEPVNSDVATRIQLDGYNWSERQYSFTGPWNKAQYTRDPKLTHSDASLNPIHGTSVNWNGWREGDPEPNGQVNPGPYDVQLQNDTGGNLGQIITVTATAP